MKNHPAFAQVDLLLHILPFLGAHPHLALKGGTAINLFVRPFPRLSVDIDLIYVPLHPRKQALASIEQSLKMLSHDISRMLPNTRVQEISSPSESIRMLVCRRKQAHVKIEINPVVRGCVFPCAVRPVNAQVQDMFERFAAVQCCSHADLYGSKLCAALDRQHPRDLFDVHLLLQNEGIGAKILDAADPSNEADSATAFLSFIV